MPRVSPKRSLTYSPGSQGSCKRKPLPPGSPFLDSGTCKVQSRPQRKLPPPSRKLSKIFLAHPTTMREMGVGEWLREGGLNSLLEALRRLQLEQEALVRRPSRSQARTVRLRLFPPPPLGLPGRPAQPPDPCHPRPLPDEAAELLTPGGGDGPRGKPGGWGRGAACTWPLSAALAGRGGTGPPPDPKSTAGDGGGVCAACLACSMGGGSGDLPQVYPRRGGAP